MQIAERSVRRIEIFEELMGMEGSAPDVSEATTMR
jgi:hypothetical protein